MKHCCLTAFIFFFLAKSVAQLGIVSPISAGLGHATVGLQSPVSIFTNQAGMVGVNKLAVVAAVEQRFLLSELRSASVGVTLPTRSGVFGFAAQSFGYEAFRRQKLGLSYARKLWKTLSVGAQFYYLQTRIPDYGSNGLVSLEIGAQANISKTLLVGAHLQNPANIELAAGESLPTVLRLGLAWTVSEKLLICSEVEKDLDQAIRWKSGINYRPVSVLNLRAGFATEPSALFFGVGYRFGDNLQADMSGSFHQVLGFSPSLGVQWY
ncbi:MAG: hypothetical protein IT258_17585 [Saprospiraceae bacterium]|nr:hypothetical protein [Saprospiraceae bacterium]